MFSVIDTCEPDLSDWCGLEWQLFIERWRILINIDRTLRSRSALMLTSRVYIATGLFIDRLTSIQRWSDWTEELSRWAIHGNPAATPSHSTPAWRKLRAVRWISFIKTTTASIWMRFRTDHWTRSLHSSLPAYKQINSERREFICSLTQKRASVIIITKNPE